MKTNYLLLIILLLVFSCSKDSPASNVSQEDPISETPNEENNNESSQTVTLQLEGVTELDLASLNVVTFNNTVGLDENGEFDVAAEDNQNGLPILFSKEDEFLFGYYRDSNDTSIDNDDILSYYFEFFPEFLAKGIEAKQIQEAVQSSPHKEELLGEMVKSLNLGEQPFGNERFSELYFVVVNEILNTNASGKKAINNSSGFKIDYYSDGEIVWPTETSLFCHLGVEIVNSETGEVKARSLLSNTTFNIMRNFIEMLDTSLIGEYEFNYQLPPEDASYSINISNGYPARNDYVTRENEKIILMKIFTLLLSDVLKNYSTIDNGCADAIGDVYSEILENQIKLFVRERSSSDFGDLASSIKDLTADILDSLVKLTPCANVSSIFKLIGTFVTKYLFAALDVYDILFWLRDAAYSDIYFEEERHFGNGISIGKLQKDYESESEFVDMQGSYKFYRASYEELIETEYAVSIGLTESSFDPFERYVPIEGLPFKSEIVGDVTIDDNTSLTTDADGDLLVYFTLGAEDSQIKVVPDFYYPDNLTKTLNITVEEGILGVWTMNEQGQDIQCPSQSYAGGYEITFFNDGTFSITTLGNPWTGNYEFNNDILTFSFSQSFFNLTSSCNGEYFNYDYTYQASYTGYYDGEEFNGTLDFGFDFNIPGGVECNIPDDFCQGNMRIFR